ncbi:uncharacterized protein LOC135462770 isoform X1 [Liolophura sinensis]|uniref:uncharacterized protein LOC135462770 isoform X1 n=2 Tax=Liolophura sinensis TaxID=3198878 RepID=UPI003159393E
MAPCFRKKSGRTAMGAILDQGRQMGLSRPDFPLPFHVRDFKILGLLCVLLGCVFSPVMAEQPACIVKGHLYTQLPWYGYLVQKTFRTEMAKIQYQLSFPLKECCLNLLIYYDDQLRHLKEGMTCHEREAILPPQNNQIIPLSLSNKTKGCVLRNDTEEPIVICVGERTFASSGPRTWYFAVSKCNKQTPTSLWYYFNISGYYGECEADPLAKTYIPPPQEQDKYMYVAVALGIVAGLAFVLAIIFFGLWVMGRRQKDTKTQKGNGNDSVTSSQATMTQDIFYVNPSISDRDTSDYSRSSSENYYEVIPEGRSYDSAEQQHRLTVPHNGAPPHSPRHMTVSSMPKEYRQYHHPPMVDDYPPPPYPMHAIGKGVYPSAHTMATSSHRHPPHHHHGHNHHPHHHAMETSA